MRSLTAVLLSVFFVSLSQAAVPVVGIKAVTSFSILADLAKQVGGDHVAIENIVGANEDAHVFKPAPRHSVMIANADVVIVNGLGFEGWIDRLIKASGYDGRIIVATKGIEAQNARDNPMMEGTGAVEDPHAWHSVPNVMKYVDNIADEFERLDPVNAATYRRNATSYKQRLLLLNKWIQDEINSVPESARRVISAHDAFQYFAKEYKVEFLAPVGVSTDAEPTPEAIIRLIKMINQQGIKAIFVENISNEKHMIMIEESTGAKIGGILYSDALSNPEDPASDFISLMKHNVSLIVKGMKKNNR